MSNKLLTLLLLFLGLLIAALIFRNGSLVWLAFPLLVYIGVGLLQYPADDAIHLQAHRSISQADSALEVEVTLLNQGITIPSLRIVDHQPEGMKIVTGQNETSASVLSGGEARLKYSFLQKRGRYAWDSIQVWAGDPLGLMMTELTLPAPAEISVKPEQENYRRLSLHPNSTLHSPGSIPARLAGSGTDFWGVRLYQPGDSLRWLDWRKNARHPGQFFTKEFEQEEIADIGLILDARSESDLQVGEDSLFEYSVRAATSLADGFVHQGHRVGLLVLGKKITYVFPGYGKHQLNSLLRCLSMVRSGTSGKLIGLHYLPMRMFSSRSLLVVLSPLTRSDSQFFPRLRASGFQVLLISPDPYDFADSTLSKDQDSQRAFLLARQERRIQLQKIARLQIQVIDWQVSQPLYPLVRSALSRQRGQLEKLEA